MSIEVFHPLQHDKIIVLIQYIVSLNVSFNLYHGIFFKYFDNKDRSQSSRSKIALYGSGSIKKLQLLLRLRLRQLACIMFLSF
jgi:hypothetical protein